MAWNSTYLPTSVQQSIAANPDLYNRSITGSPDRAIGITFDFGSGEERQQGDLGYGTMKVNSGNGLAEASDTWNGSRLWELMQDPNFSGYRTIASSDDFSDPNRWRPGAEQGILGSAKWDPQAGLMINSDVLRQYWIPKEDSFMDKVMSYLPAVAGATMAGAGLNYLFGPGATAGAAGDFVGPPVEMGPGFVSGAGSTGAGATSFADGLTNLGAEYAGNLGNVGNLGYTGLGAGSIMDAITGSGTVSGIWDAIKGNPGDALGILAGLYGLYNKNQNSKDLGGLASDLLEQSDPFGSQRGFYQDKLKNTYTDPMSIYNSPEYQGLANIYRQKIEAKDAAAGRRSQYSARELDMQNNFLNYLNQYRQGLLSPSGAGISPNVGAGAQAATQSIQAGNNIGDVVGLLSYLFPNSSSGRVNRGGSESSNSNNQGVDV